MKFILKDQFILDWENAYDRIQNQYNVLDKRVNYIYKTICKTFEEDEDYIHCTSHLNFGLNQDDKDL